MQIIDVTLRDGGHVRDFNWPIRFAQKHYLSLSKIPEIKSHRVIDSPESVSLVKPPTTIIKDTREVINNNQ